MINHNAFPPTRRRFLSTLAKAGFATSLLPNYSLKNSPIAWSNEFAASKNTAFRPLKILILGGTSFLGPHQIAYALERGHEITTFTRGKTKPTVHTELFANVEALIGDRENDLNALKGRKWDAVIDNSGYRVKWTKATAELLKENVGNYLYTSSTGVYYPYLSSDIKESTALVLDVPSDIDENQSMEYNYGVMKAKSEIEATLSFGKDRTIVVRPTYMMGPGDKTDRFTYWPIRLSRGGDILIPGKADDPVQYIDVRDVAEWMIRLIESKNAGTYNAVGPPSSTGMNAFVYGAHAAFNSMATFHKIPDYAFLMKHNIPYAIPWIMPTGDNFGSAQVNNQMGISNGLVFRPLANSVADIHAWWHSGVVSKERQQQLIAGPKSLMAREKDVLLAWKSNKQ